MATDKGLAPDTSPTSSRPSKLDLVKRVSRRPMVIASITSIGLAAGLGPTIESKFAEQQPMPVAGASMPGAADPTAVLGLASDVHKAAFRPTNEKPKAEAAKPAPAPRPAAPVAALQVKDMATEARKKEWRAYCNAVEHAQSARLASAQKALTSGTSISESSNRPAPARPGIQAVKTTSASYADDLTPGVSLGGRGRYGGVSGPSPYGSDQKLAFMRSVGDTSGRSDTLMAAVRDPISPYLITAGDFINCVAVTGENSEAPGIFVGRVARNVYDSATGRYLLIPQGTKVIGVADIHVSAGQTRIPTAITRLIFPDGESLDLGSMPAADRSGFAGLHDQVDTHWWSKFGNAVILGTAGAGVQIAQGGGGYSRRGYDAQQLAAAAMARQFAQLGQEYARVGLSIPNTLKVRPGYRFVVQVTKDIVLRPYVDERTHPLLSAPVVR